jgi:hypothetical protein
VGAKTTREDTASVLSTVPLKHRGKTYNPGKQRARLSGETRNPQNYTPTLGLHQQDSPVTIIAFYAVHNKLEIRHCFRDLRLSG